MSTGVAAATGGASETSSQPIRTPSGSVGRVGRAGRRLAVAAVRSPAAWVAVTTLSLYLFAARERWNRVQYGLDLGIFTEATRRYAHGEWPWSMVKGRGGFNLLGDHFSPAMALFALPYRVVPDARTLVAVQAVLVALTAGIITAAGTRVAGRCVGIAFGAGYAFAYGTSAMAMFDVHEVCLALPLLAMAGVAWMQRRWWAVTAWTAPLMLVKEDSVFLLLGFALVLATSRAWRQAVALTAFAVAAFALIVTVLIPELSWTGTWTYWSAAPGRGSLLAPVTTLAEALPAAGLPLAAALLAPTLGLALRSPLALAVLPPLLVRLASPDRVYWGLAFHYNATVTVILSVAGVDAWRRLRARRDVPRLRARVCAAALLVPAVLVAGCGPWGRTVRQWGRPNDFEVVRAYLAAFSDSAPEGGHDSIAADRRFLSYLADSYSVHELHPGLVDSTGRRIFPHWVLTQCSFLDDDVPAGKADDARRPPELAGQGWRYTENVFWAAGSPRHCVATLWVATGRYSRD